jgi:hypothetical protein
VTTLFLTVSISWIAEVDRASAGRCVDYRDYIHVVREAPWPGDGGPVLIRDGIGYAADQAQGLVVVDLSTPTDPMILDADALPGPAFDIAVVGDFLFIAGGSAGLWVVDISTPDTPQLVQTNNDGGSVDRLVAHDGLVFCVNYDELLIFNATNAPGVNLIGRISHPSYAFGEPYDVDVVGNTVYVAGFAAIYVIDVSDPEQPRRVRSLDVLASRIVVDKDRAYTWMNYDNTLIVMDVAKPENPTIRSTVDLYHLQDLVVNPNPSGPGRVFVLSDVGVSAIDFADPDAPEILGVVTPLYYGSRGGLGLLGEYVVLAGYATMNIIDASNPRSVPPTGRIEGQARVTVRGENVFAAAGDDGVQVWSIANPASPFLLGRADLPFYALKLVLDGDIAWVSDGQSVASVVVSEPTRPSVIGIIDTEAQFSDFDVADGYLYTIAGYGGDTFAVYDVTDPSIVRPAASLIDFGFQIQVEDSYAFVGSYTTIYDVSEPTNPIEVSNISPWRGPVFFDVRDGLLHYVGGAHGFYQVIDVSDPTNPHGGAARLALGGTVLGGARYAYVTGYRGQVSIVDLSDLASPFTFANLGFSGERRGTAAVGENVVLVARDGGLDIFPTPCGIITPVSLTDLSAEVLSADGVRLRWTVHEDTFSHFDILRGATIVSDQSDYGYVGRVMGSSSHGNGAHRAVYQYIDTDIAPGTTYTYQIVGHMSDGATVRAGPITARTSSVQFALHRVRPNPSPGATLFTFSVPYDSRVTLRIYDASGGMVRSLVNAQQIAGRHMSTWDGKDNAGLDVPSGVYFVRFEHPAGVRVQRFTLVR